MWQGREGSWGPARGCGCCPEEGQSLQPRPRWGGWAGKEGGRSQGRHAGSAGWALRICTQTCPPRAATPALGCRGSSVKVHDLHEGRAFAFVLSPCLRLWPAGEFGDSNLCLPGRPHEPGVLWAVGVRPEGNFVASSSWVFCGRQVCHLAKPQTSLYRKRARADSLGEAHGQTVFSRNRGTVPRAAIL